jgi:hypothetical protein
VNSFEYEFILNARDFKSPTMSTGAHQIPLHACEYRIPEHLFAEKNTMLRWFTTVEVT